MGGASGDVTLLLLMRAGLAEAPASLQSLEKLACKRRYGLTSVGKQLPAFSVAPSQGPIVIRAHRTFRWKAHSGNDHSVGCCDVTSHDRIPSFTNICSVLAATLCDLRAAGPASPDSLIHRLHRKPDTYCIWHHVCGTGICTVVAKTRAGESSSETIARLLPDTLRTT